MMEAWGDFLESLTTEGGRVFIMLVIATVLFWVCVWQAPAWAFRYQDMVLGGLLTVLAGKVRNGTGKPNQ